MLSEPLTVLIVDDDPDSIHALSAALAPTYRVQAALTGLGAMALAIGEPRPDLILLDVVMPGLDGFAVLRRLKADPLTRDIPVLFLTARDQLADEERGLNLGAVDYLTKPVHPPILLARVRTHLALYRQNRELELKVQERTAELQETRMEVIRRLGRAAEYRDNETGLHVIRMSHYARLIAEALDIGEAWTELVYSAAPMHDIGKIAIPDRILLKPGPLDAEEWALMKRHSEYGARIIGESRSLLLRTAAEIALAHHERWDGSGYPHGLAREAIPLAARIVAVADVFDALTTARPYKPAWTVEAAATYLDENVGSHFDPQLVCLFRDRFSEVLEIREEFAETEAPVLATVE